METILRIKVSDLDVDFIKAIKSLFKKLHLFKFTLLNVIKVASTQTSEIKNIRVNLLINKLSKET